MSSRIMNRLASTSVAARPTTPAGFVSRIAPPFHGVATTLPAIDASRGAMNGIWIRLAPACGAAPRPATSASETSFESPRIPVLRDPPAHRARLGPFVASAFLGSPAQGGNGRYRKIRPLPTTRRSNAGPARVRECALRPRGDRQQGRVAAARPDELHADGHAGGPREAGQRDAGHVEQRPRVV